MAGKVCEVPADLRRDYSRLESFGIFADFAKGHLRCISPLGDEIDFGDNLTGDPYSTVAIFGHSEPNLAGDGRSVSLDKLY
jgi:hypothetical protein